jgi:hypothetical protein
MKHPEVLEAAAIVVYGERWKAALARDLGLAPRLLYDWLEGRAPVPLRVWIALTLALATQARQAIDLLQQLEEIEAVESIHECLAGDDGEFVEADVSEGAGEEAVLSAKTRALCPWFSDPDGSRGHDQTMQTAH